MAQLQVIHQLRLAGVAAGVLWIAAGVISQATDAPSPSQTAAHDFSAAPHPGRLARAVPGDGLTATDETRAASFESEQAMASWNHLLQHSGLDTRWLQSHGFTPGSEAFHRLHALLNGHTAVRGTNAIPIAFGPQGGIAESVPGRTPVLSPHERYVDAHLPIEALNGDSVLLRWRNASDNTLLNLSSQSLPSEVGGTVPLWMHLTDDWSPGRYRVEVLSANGALNLLAEGEFEIAAPGGHLTPFAYEASAPAMPATLQ
ncbi:hypothetical protein [Diaphorobacter caeni]|uniref:hypothetical protein n=1 Tax=Diaphorobacter caeni TaxID=2784387 RepID=UPI00188F9BCC|nr:hypothetical protein [Diaphorobacter caeni]MBF5002785.1 hypothetical protein [Diaphorobacter caeni]